MEIVVLLVLLLGVLCLWHVMGALALQEEKPAPEYKYDHGTNPSIETYSTIQPNPTISIHPINETIVDDAWIQYTTNEDCDFIFKAGSKVDLSHNPLKYEELIDSFTDMYKCCLANQ